MLMVMFICAVRNENRKAKKFGTRSNQELLMEEALKEAWRKQDNILAQNSLDRCSCEDGEIS